jgi:ATP-binding cassette subfamily B protein RaxB
MDEVISLNDAHDYHALLNALRAERLYLQVCLRTEIAMKSSIHWTPSMTQRVKLLFASIFSRRPPQVAVHTCTAKCGLDCLAIISSYYRRDVDVTCLKNMRGPQKLAVTLDELVQTADRVGLSSRILIVKPHDLRSITKPAILCWNSSHFVVLTRTSKAKVYIHDPDIGAIAHTYVEVSSHFAGTVVELSPIPNSTWSSDTRTVSLTGMLRAISHQTTRIGLLILFALLSQSFSLLSPYYFQLVVDYVLRVQDPGVLYYITAIFLVLGLSEWVTETGRMHLSAQFGAILNSTFFNAIFRHMLRLPIEFFVSRDSSNLAAKIDSMTELREIFTRELPRIFVSTLMFGTTLVVLCSYSVVLTALVTLVLAAYVVFRVITYRKIRLHFESTFVKRAHAAAYFVDTVRSIVSVKAHNIETLRTNNWRKHVAENARSQYLTDVSLETLRLARDRSTQLENIISLFFASQFIMSRQMTIGMVMAYFMYKRLYWDSGQTVIDVVFRLRLARIHLDRLADILLAKQEAAYKTAGHPVYFDLTEPTIVVKDLRYTFPGSRSSVFRPLNFEINVGERVAIAGHSGAGKTTLIHILLGLRLGYQGRITISGHELACIPREQWLGRVSVVLQGQQLFNGSIRENICFGAAAIDERRLERAAENACIQQRINSLPMRYDTQMGEISQLLSAGEIQRILIARALYRDAPLLILDEGTANLDAETESHLLDNLRNLKLTVIHATHSLHVFNDATLVIHLGES